MIIDEPLSGDPVVHARLPPRGKMLKDKCQALAREVALGVLMHGGAAFLFEKPLRKVLLVAGLGPVIIVNVEHLLLLPLLLSRRSLCSLLPLSGFRFLWDDWFFEVQGLLMRLRVLRVENRKVPDGPNVLLDPVEILTDQVLAGLPVAADNDVPESAAPHPISNIAQRKFITVEISQPVPDRQVLEQKGRSILHQEHPRSQDIAEQLLGEDQLLREVHLIECCQWAAGSESLGPFRIFSQRFLSLRQLLLAHLRIQIAFSLLPGPPNQLPLVHLEVDDYRRTHSLGPRFNVLPLEGQSVDQDGTIATG